MSRVRRESLRISASERPGWLQVSETTPSVGQQVYCVEGIAEVSRILGRTSDGSRLLELILDDRPKVPYFAAASNVLVRADGERIVGEMLPI